MYVPRERLERGRTHVETVYYTLLEKVLAERWPEHVFHELFIQYIYKGVLLPEIIRDKTKMLDKHFRMLVSRAFEYKFEHLKSELAFPDFENQERDPYVICYEWVISNIDKVTGLVGRGYLEELKQSQPDILARMICNEIIFIASMSLLRELNLIR